MNVTKEQITDIAKSIGLGYAELMAFIATESPMKGFVNGKLLIQFEPAHFRKMEPYAPSGKWSVNKVDVQTKEWEAFNNAFSIDPESAMKATSIGLPQIMGFNFNQCGYKSVGEMWDDFKKGELQQIQALARFIQYNKRLHTAIKIQDWHNVASMYNGAGYKALSTRLGREPYNITLQKNFDKYSA